MAVAGSTSRACVGGPAKSTTELLCLYTFYLSSFVPERGKVLPRRISGTCAKHQRALRVAIVRARQLALLPYAAD